MLLKLFICLLMLEGLISFRPAQAHLRDYLVTYGYWTLPKGKVELEFWTDYRKINSGQSQLVHQSEIEYGITDRLLLGIYGVFVRPSGGNTEYRQTKFETRYRLAEPGMFFFDPALYLEYVKGAGDRPDKVEAKVILSKYLANGTNLTINAIAEKEKEPGTHWEYGYTAGISKRVRPKLTLGLEIKGEEDEFYLIPGAYIDIPPNKRINIGPAFGLTGESIDFQLKSIVEYEF